MLLARRAIRPRRPDLTRDEYFWIRLEVVPSENVYSIERLQLRRLIGMFESACQIKGLDNRMVVRRVQPDDLGITGRRFRKQVGIRSHEVRELHLRLVGIAAWTQDMPYEVDRLRVIRRDRKDVDLVPILYCEPAHLRANHFGIAGVADFDAQHGALFMRYQALDFNVPQCRRGENSSSQIEYFHEGLLIAQLVNCWAAHHAFYRHHRTKWRYHQGIAVLDSLQIAPNAMEEQVIRVHFFHQLLSSIVLKTPERALRCHTTRHKQRIQRSGKRTHVIRARRSDVANHIHAHRAQPQQ